MKQPSKHIPYLIEQTNCNPECPVLNSVKITNKKDMFAQISNGQKFIYATKKKVISELIEKKRELLRDYIKHNRDKYKGKTVTGYQRYDNVLDDNPEEMKDLENEVMCMLLNISDNMGSDQWLEKLLYYLKIVESEIHAKDCIENKHID